MNHEEAILKLKDGVEQLLLRSLDEQLMQDAIVAMVGALVETHPDRNALHASFSRIYQRIGGSDRAVHAMGQGRQGSLAILAGFSEAIGRELP